MSKIAAMPIYAKKIKNHRLKNHSADYLETCYVASGTLVLQNFYK